MQELRNTDVIRVLGKLPANVRLFLEEHTAFLAGGFIRDTLAERAPHDIDIFGPLAELEDFRMDMGGVQYTKFATTYTPLAGLPVQLVTGFSYWNPTDLLLRFNFTVNQAAIWYEDGTWCSLCSDRFYEDLAAERLVYGGRQQRETAAHSLMKVVSLVNNGWAIDVEELMKVTASATFGMRHKTVGEAIEELVAHARGEYLCLTKENPAQAARSNFSERVSFTTSPELELTESIF
jgi:hypothetical protein